MLGECVHPKGRLGISYVIPCTLNLNLSWCWRGILMLQYILLMSILVRCRCMRCIWTISSRAPNWSSVGMVNGLALSVMSLLMILTSAMSAALMADLYFVNALKFDALCSLILSRLSVAICIAMASSVFSFDSPMSGTY